MESQKDIFDLFKDPENTSGGDSPIGDAWNEQPPETAWAQLEGQLEANQNQIRLKRWKQVGIAASFLSVVLCLALWAVLSSGTEFSNPFIPQKSQPQTQPFIPNPDQIANTPQDTLPDTLFVAQQSLTPQPISPQNQIANRQSNEPDAFETGVPDSLGIDPVPLEEPLPSLVKGPNDPNDSPETAPNEPQNPAFPQIPLPVHTPLEPNPNNSLTPNAITNNQFNYNPGNFQNINPSTNQIKFQLNPQNPNNVVLKNNPARIANLEKFNWLIGNWTDNGARGTSAEEWKQVNDFTIQGKGFFIVNGDTTFTENMRLMQKGEDIYYVVAVDGSGQYRKYRLLSYDPQRIIFQDDSVQEFPNQIIYQKNSRNKYSTIMQNENQANLSNRSQQDYLIQRNEQNYQGQFQRSMKRE